MSLGRSLGLGRVLGRGDGRGWLGSPPGRRRWGGGSGNRRGGRGSGAQAGLQGHQARGDLGKAQGGLGARQLQEAQLEGDGRLGGQPGNRLAGQEQLGQEDLQALGAEVAGDGQHLGAHFGAGLEERAGLAAVRGQEATAQVLQEGRDQIGLAAREGREGFEHASRIMVG